MHPDKNQFLKTLESARQKAGAHLTEKATGLQRVLEISRQIATLDLDKALELIVDHILELTRASRGMVMLFDDQGTLQFQYGKGLEREEVESGEFEISRSVTQQAVAEQRILVVDDVASSEFRTKHSIVRLGLNALMVIPMKGRSEIIGVIYTDTDQPGHSMSLEDPSIFSAFGSQAAIAIENARLHRKMQEDYLFLKDPPVAPGRIGKLVYQSRVMQRVRHAIEQVLNNDITVLIYGESGTGKELVAQAIHDLGARKKHKFVAQNTGALPDTLLESELFGHRRGAFTGAATDKAGLFEIADKGTVFLDEIGEASPAMQVRLLRFLETGRFRRTGDTQERSSNVRVIAATHRNLREEVDQGRFREDLYYRLNVYPIIIAPLRDRREDIPLLVRHFVEAFNKKLDKHIDLIPRRVLKHLSEQPWQGNVRELKNFVHRMMVLSPQNTLMLPDATFETEDEGEAPVEEEDNLKTLCEMERDYLIYVLEKYRGNQTRAARCLGLKRTTFISRLKKLGIDFPGP